MQHQVQIIRRPLLVRRIKRNVFLCRRVDSHRARHRWIRLLPRLNPRRRVQIHRRLQPILVQLFQERIRVGKQHLVPRVARPPQHLSRLIHRAHRPQLLIAHVPVHVDDQHIQRRVILPEVPHQLVESLVGIRPIPRPPDAERKPRRQRNAPGHAHKIAQRLLVVVPVTEKVPVAVRARLFIRRPLHHPGPLALFALKKPKISRIEQRPCRVVHQHPARARYQPLPYRLFGLRSPRRIQRPRGAHQIIGIAVARMPHDVLAVNLERNSKVLRIEHSTRPGVPATSYERVSASV